MIDILQAQYSLVKRSREILFNYCSGISQEDFISEESSIGRGSIRNLLVHNANAYQFWIAKHSLNKEIDFTAYISVNTIIEIQALFKTIDDLVNDFFNFVKTNNHTCLEIKLNGNFKLIDVLELFTHVITHEYHHKGQILSLGRSLGYTPVDTDIL